MTTAPRIDKFRRLLRQARIDGAVVGGPANVCYLTGFLASLDRPSFAVIGSERVALVVAGSAEAARRALGIDAEVFGYRAPGILDEVVDVDRGSAEALGRAVEAAGLAGKQIGVDEARVSALHARAVASAGTVIPLAGQVESLRRIKDSDEIDQIRAAVELNDVGFAAAGRAIGPGVSELAVMAAVVDAMQQATGMPIDLLDPTNAFVSGPRTMLGAAPATSRRLESGDLMIVDLNPFIGRYKGDTTRTFAVGEPTAEQRRAHDALARGLAEAERVARPGTRGSEVFAALLRPVAEAGLGDGFKFHGGHALGLDHLERPYIIPAEDMRLEEGMVIALEPAVYLPGIGGLRVEDNYLVTASGLEPLSRYPRKLTVCQGPR